MMGLRPRQGNPRLVFRLFKSYEPGISLSQPQLHLVLEVWKRKIHFIAELHKTDSHTVDSRYLEFGYLEYPLISR